MKRIKFLFILFISFLFGLQNQPAKADTIYVHLPSPSQEICQSGGFDTFVFYKAPGFGLTTWYVGSISQGVGDSLIFVPTTIGTFQVTCTWNYNWEGCNLTLFDSPPSHAQFEVLSGGSINSTKDTVWMCGNSVRVGPGSISGDEATNWYWGSITGFHSVDAPVTITAGGTYFFYRENPCGITVDTFRVVKLPTTVPVWNDTSFCNVPVVLTLDPGPGWFVHTWSTGDTTQTLNVNSDGTYTVNLSNACISGSSSITVVQETFPLPNIGNDQILCYGNSVVLNPNPGFVYDSYSWSNAYHGATLSVTETGGYAVTVTKGQCVSYSNSIFIRFMHPYQDNSICIVTVDPIIGKNKVVWKPTSNVGTASYNVYKLSGSYTLIGNIPHDDVSSLTFYDTISNPYVSSVRYKITTVDTCGNESDFSPAHGTIKINSNPGTGGVVDLTIVDHYFDESGTYTPSKYYVLIDSLNNGNLRILDSIDAVYNSYTILSPHAGSTYLLGVAFPWACESVKSSINMSYSNKSYLIMSDNNISYSDISISCYPNPSSDGIFHLKGGPVDVQVMNALGQIIYTNTNISEINLSGVDKGVYFARLTRQGAINVTLISK